CTVNASGSWINIPPAVGVYLQNTIASNNGYEWMELCGSASGSGYIDFTSVNISHIHSAVISMIGQYGTELIVLQV
ncbi:MAG: hypothetical protein ACKPKO_20160, partial [Candidatus Fonsibacter sp.]